MKSLVRPGASGLFRLGPGAPKHLANRCVGNGTSYLVLYVAPPAKICSAGWTNDKHVVRHRLSRRRDDVAAFIACKRCFCLLNVVDHFPKFPLRLVKPRSQGAPCDAVKLTVHLKARSKRRMQLFWDADFGTSLWIATGTRVPVFQREYAEAA